MSRQPFQKFVVNYAPGDVIYNEGDPGATMYIVQSGRVELFRSNEEHKRSRGVMEKGDFFGEMSILEGLPRGSSAEAIEESELIEINSMTFDKMIKGNIEIAIRLLRKLSIRLRDAEQKLEEFEISGLRKTDGQRPAAAPNPQGRHSIQTGVRLEVPGDDLAFPVSEPESLIGRYDPVTELKPDVDLTEADLKRSVSRRHARVVKTGDRYSVIEEVGALNGTFVNGVKLITGEPHLIGDGDKLALGMVHLVFRTR